MEDKKSSLCKRWFLYGEVQENARREKKQKKNKVPVQESKSGITQNPPLLTPKMENGSKMHVVSRSSTRAGGKLAFSLKQKPKVVAPVVKFGADDDEDEVDERNSSYEAQPKRQKLNQPEASQTSSSGGAGEPTPPSSLEVKKVADKLASFVAKNGRQFEQITRQKNPGDTPFKFLFDQNSQDYKYYEYRLLEEEKVQQRKDSQPLQAVSSAPFRNQNVQQKQLPDSSYQIPASAMYESEGQGPPKKGHHTGDYIPPEELAKFLSTCNAAAARKQQ